jgi:hypothetical protein
MNINSNNFYDHIKINNTNYIDKAIKYFKKAIILSKMNTYPDSMKTLYNFYSSYITEGKDQQNKGNVEDSNIFIKRGKFQTN